MAATEWIVTMREGLRLLERYPQDILHVPYEALCDAPQTTCRRLARFAGLEDDPVFLDYAERVLQPGSSRHEFELPSALETPFRTTIDALATRKAA